MANSTMLTYLSRLFISSKLSLLLAVPAVSH